MTRFEEIKAEWQEYHVAREDDVRLLIEYVEASEAWHELYPALPFGKDLDAIRQKLGLK